MNLDGQQGTTIEVVEQVLIILLCGGYLEAEEQLACFCARKRMARLVARYAACTHLNLRLPEAEWRCRHSDPGAPTRAEVAIQLAPQCQNVTLALHGGLLTPAACLWQCITTIQLSGMQLSHTSPSQLQLHKLPHLHTLSLLGCHLAHSSQPPATSKQSRSTTVRNLECFNGTDDLLPRLALNELVDKRQLQTVITDQAAITTFLPQLPALQELHICYHHRALGDQMLPHRRALSDEGFQRLLAHPRLARVQLSDVRLQHSHADQPCTWDSLHLLAGTTLTDLAHMPLAGIKSCVVHGRLIVRQEDSDEGADAAAVSSISNAQHLVFQAGAHANQKDWVPVKPGFELYFGRFAMHPSSQAIALVLRHLATGTALMLKALIAAPPAVVASLEAAPESLTTMYFCFEHGDYMDAAAAGVLTHMPHVTRAVVRVTGGAPVMSCLREQLKFIVAGVVWPLELTIVIACKQWRRTKGKAIREWVATHASKHVHVQFQFAATKW